MGRGRLVDPRRSRRDAAELSQPRAAARTLLSLVTECSKWGLFTRPLTENWGRGRIQLIGDAAHAMLPNAGQGACQAFEDAYILARWLAQPGDLPRPCEFPPHPHPARARRAAPLLRDCPDQTRVRTARSEYGRRRKVDAVDAMAWIWGYDPVNAWDQAWTIPRAPTHCKGITNTIVQYFPINGCWSL